MKQSGILYLSAKDVENSGLSMIEIISSVEDILKEKYFKRIEMPPKPGIHPRSDAFIHAMPAFIPRMDIAGIKWIAGYLQNPEKGLPYISGILVLNDPETGLPISVMDASWITAKRTAAITALSAKHLARKDLESIGIVGCGVQARSHLEALSVIFKGIKKVRAYDIVKEKLFLYADYVRSNFNYDVIESTDPKEAICGSDIIITATPILSKPKPIAKFEWVKKGSLVCPIEFDSYWDSNTFSKPDRLFTDDVMQLKYYKKIGRFKAIKRIHGELSEIIMGVKKGRINEAHRITVVNLGLALVDVAVASQIYEKAVKKNLGVLLPY
ncbi:MAG: ornithine cyclodeaminase family protein [Nitrososphaeria archaeon]